MAAAARPALGTGFLPDRLEEIDAAWLTGALAGRLERDARVESISIERIGEGVGLMGQLGRLHVRWSDASARAPSTMVVKLPTTDPVNRASAQLLGLYERECRFYQELAPALPIRTARCLYARAEPDPNAPGDPERFERALDRLPGWLMRLLLSLSEWHLRRHPRRAVLVLEDLAGLRPGDQVAGGTRRDWEAALGLLGRLHAAGWRNESLIGRPWLGRMATTVRFNQTLFRDRMRRVPERWARRLTPRGRALRDWLLVNGERLLAELCDSSDTLLHSDFRLDNLFFDDARGEVIAVDWQLPARGPAILDLAYFLSGVLTREDDAESEQALVEHYHRALVEGGVSDYPLDRCLADHARARLASWHRCLTAVTSVPTADARGTALLESWWDRMSGRLDLIDPDRLLPAR